MSEDRMRRFILEAQRADHYLYACEWRRIIRAEHPRSERRPLFRALRKAGRRCRAEREAENRRLDAAATGNPPQEQG